MRRMTKTHLNCFIAFTAIAAMTSQWNGLNSVYGLLKPLTTILVILLVCLFRTDNSRNTILVVVALVACLTGDVLLLDEARFALGLTSFLLAQLIFAYVFFTMADGQLGYASLVVLSIAGLSFYWFLYPQLGALAIPVAIYLCCISTMCWLAVNLYRVKPSPAAYLLCVAGILFMLSDTIIAINKFLHPFSFSQVVILTTYWVSISLIANAFTIDRFLRTNDGEK